MAWHPTTLVPDAGYTTLALMKMGTITIMPTTLCRVLVTLHPQQCMAPVTTLLLGMVTPKHQPRKPWMQGVQ